MRRIKILLKIEGATHVAPFPYPPSHQKSLHDALIPAIFFRINVYIFDDTRVCAEFGRVCHLLKKNLFPLRNQLDLVFRRRIVLVGCIFQVHFIFKFHSAAAAAGERYAAKFYARFCGADAKKKQFTIWFSGWHDAVTKIVFANRVHDCVTVVWNAFITLDAPTSTILFRYTLETWHVRRRIQFTLYWR